MARQRGRSDPRWLHPAQVQQGHQQLEELKQHLAAAFEERAAAQGALAEVQAQLAEQAQHVDALGSEHAQMAAQLARADAHGAELAEDLLAAQVNR